MPLGGPALAEDELATVKDWILSLQSEGKSVSQKSTCQSEQSIVDMISADLDSLSSRDRRNTRYIMLDSFAGPGESAEEERTRLERAVKKLLNSLSWNEKIVKPKIVGNAKTGYALRLELDSMDWDFSDWEAIQKENPFAEIQKQKYAHLTDKFKDQTNSSLPFISGSVFINRAAVPPLYHRLLDLPTNVIQLEATLEVDTAANLAKNNVKTSGFKNSGVSQHNRVIERHDTKYGAYWRSYDFNGSGGEKNIFGDPLNFKADGGEVIFNLPNGMQAYYLYDSKGNRLDKAPTEVVSDGRRPDHAVVNGLSCMRCHSGGIINKADEVRDFYSSDAFSEAEKNRVLARYPEKSVMDQTITQDTSRYVQALTKIFGATPPPEDDPITYVNERYEGPVSSSKAACELALDQQVLGELVSTTIRDLPGLGNLFINCQSIHRDAFEVELADLEVKTNEQGALERISLRPDAKRKSSFQEKLQAQSPFDNIRGLTRDLIKEVESPEDFFALFEPSNKDPKSFEFKETEDFMVRNIDVLISKGGTFQDLDLARQKNFNISNELILMQKQATLAETNEELLHALTPVLKVSDVEIDKLRISHIPLLLELGGTTEDLSLWREQAANKDNAAIFFANEVELDIPESISKVSLSKITEDKNRKIISSIEEQLPLIKSKEEFLALYNPLINKNDPKYQKALYASLEKNILRLLDLGGSLNDLEMLIFLSPSLENAQKLLIAQAGLATTPEELLAIYDFSNRSLSKAEKKLIDQQKAELAARLFNLGASSVQVREWRQGVVSFKNELELLHYEFQAAKTLEEFNSSADTLGQFFYKKGERKKLREVVLDNFNHFIKLGGTNDKLEKLLRNI